jgi:hypothetical protein
MPNDVCKELVGVFELRPMATRGAADANVFALDIHFPHNLWQSALEAQDEQLNELVQEFCQSGRVVGAVDYALVVDGIPLGNRAKLQTEELGRVWAT